MPITAIHAIHHFQYAKPSGIKYIAARRQAYEPSFITTPASNIEAAVGAATWPVGAHVWNGHIPARTAKPTKINGNTQICTAGAKGCLTSSRISNVCPPALKKTAK